MKSSSPPRSWLVATLIIVAWISGASAGMYNTSYSKVLTWQAPQGADVTKVNGTIAWNNLATASDTCVGQQPNTDPEKNSMNFVPPAPSNTVGVANALQGVASSSARDTYQVSGFAGNPAMLSITTTANVSGLTGTPACPGGVATASSTAMNSISVNGAVFVSAETFINNKLTLLPIQAGTLLISTQASNDLAAPKAMVSDPVTETIVDLKTGVSTTQQVFSTGFSATNGEISVDPVTGALFIGAPKGDALFSYDVGPGVTTDQVGSAEVLNGKLILTGSLASLTWTPGTSANGTIGFFLSANQIPGLTASVAFNNLVVGDTYSLSITDPENALGQTSSVAPPVPEPPAIILLGMGLLGVVGHVLRQRNRIGYRLLWRS